MGRQRRWRGAWLSLALLTALLGHGHARAQPDPASSSQADGDDNAAADIFSDPMAELLAARSRTPSQVGSLHRAAGTIEAVLDIYRLALMEMVPAVRRVRSAGNVPGATPETAIPAAAAEVFQGVERSVRRRVPEQALEAIGRGYHAEVTDYLEVLSGGVGLGDVVRPARGLVAAMHRVCRRADEVVDLFSRNRPIRTRVVDGGEILDELTEALEELEAADRQVGRLRKQRAPQDRVAAGYRRLEIALGHVLNLWALARDSGLDFATAANQIIAGFDVPAQISTESLEAVLARVRYYLGDLEAVVATMEQAPSPPGTSVHATLLETEGGEAKVELGWAASAVADVPAAAVRIYRGDDVATTRRLLSDYLRCRGRPEDEAGPIIESSLQSLSAEPIRVASVAPGRTTWTETLAAAPVAPPIYRVVPVSTFGIEAASARVVPVTVPTVLEGATEVRADVADVRPAAEAFYRDADRVSVRWKASPNDVRRDPESLAYAAASGLPIVEAYVVERLTGDVEQIIAIVAAGQQRVEDRPPIAALAEGVRYRVTARAQDGRLARAPQACSISAPVRRALQPLVAAAQNGAASIVYPTQWERERAEQLTDPEALRRARVAFDERPPMERERLLGTWWLDTPAAQRIRWLRDWPELMSDAERSTWLARWDGTLSARDLPWAQAELFFTAFAELNGEVERWWQLLDDETQKAHVDGWRASRGPGFQAWFDAAVASSTPEAQTALAAAKKTVWWLARDPIERRQRLLPWWDTLDEVERHEALLSWYAGLSEPVRRSIRWPDWALRSDVEREHLLRMVLLDLPAQLWRRALAWSDWESLNGEARLAAIRAEVGPGRTMLARVRWALRPLDAGLSFQLPAVIALLFGTLGFLGLFWRARRGLSTGGEA